MGEGRLAAKGLRCHHGLASCVAERALARRAEEQRSGGEEPREGDVVEATVVAWGSGLDAVAEWSGGRLYLRGALPGERLRVRLRGGRGRWRGEVVSWVRRSSSRCEPSCAVASRCGGCDLQHMAYRAQLAWKRDEVMRAVRTGLGRPVQVAELLAPEEPRGHRTKIGLRIGGAAGALTAGLFAPHTREVVAISECEVQDANGTAFALRLVALASKLGVPPFEEESGRGLLRAVVVRVGHGTGELQVTWVLSARSQQYEPALTAAALEAGALSVALNFHAEDGKQLAGSRLVHAGGAARIRAEVCGQSYLVSAGAFFQTSKFGAEALSRQVRAWAGSAPHGRLLDLYSGLGFFGLPLASRFREVVAMEESHAATEDGIASAAGSGVRNISFREGRVESSLRAFLRSGGEATTVIADPPRSGLSAEVAEMLTSELTPERLIYVSCDLDALARDVAVLTQGGMQLEEVQPVEMFPMTKHVETVALFRPNPVLAMARRMGGRR